MANKIWKQKDKCALKESPKFRGEITIVHPPYNATDKESTYQVLWKGYSIAYVYLGDALITPEEADEEQKKTKPQCGVDT
jgi:hypothetical protein